MRKGKLCSSINVASSIEEMPSHSWDHTCHCECGAYWKLNDHLECPDCGNTKYDLVSAPRDEYAPEG